MNKSAETVTPPVRTPIIPQPRQPLSPGATIASPIPAPHITPMRMPAPVAFAPAVSEPPLLAPPAISAPSRTTLPAEETHTLPEPAPLSAPSIVPSPTEAAIAELPATQLQVRALRKSYRKGQVEIPVLRGVDLEINRGEMLAIVGQSGCGKSTLLHLLGTLDAPDAGEVLLDGKRIDNLPSAARDKLRNEYFGMIFQFYHLLPELTTLENVLAPLMITHSTWSYYRRRREHTAAAVELLNLVGLSHRLKHRPRELSGGEMQRAAIARALITRPKVLLADEPTGNLDQSTGGEILQLLRTLNRDQKLTIVMVTHDAGIAHSADRAVRLVAGCVETA